MTDQFVESFVEKLILLEQRTGARVHYRVMDPFRAPFHDHLSIQRAAKQIADFIGLGGFTFIVAVSKQKVNVGGHIDLATNGKDVFVEIDEDTMRFPDAVGATLCHEACHKWLQVEGISSPIEIENEILTDITTVFLGLGKIMLNGCRATHVRSEPIPDGTQIITETKTSGYLDRDQLAFAYLLVCAMRNIPLSECTMGLNAEARQAIDACHTSFSHHYDSRFHLPETTREAIRGFNDGIIAFQERMAELDKHLAYIRKSLCETVEGFPVASHKKLKSLRRKMAAMTQDVEPDPALHFLRAILKKREFDRLNNAVCAIEQDSEMFLGHAVAFGRRLHQNSTLFPAPCSGMFNIVTCPQDGTRLRLPEESGDIIATCPTCKYQFAYDTSSLLFPDLVAHRKPTWSERIMNRIRRKRNA